jgi:ABC-2 type transport system ATP-binding protein
MGKTILVSSHILTELSTFCNTVGIIEKGKLIAAGEVGAILGGLRAHREFAVALLDAADSTRAASFFEKRSGVQRAEAAGGTVRLFLDATEEELASLVEALVGEGIRFTEFREEMADLETAFMALTKGQLG